MYIYTVTLFSLFFNTLFKPFSPILPFAQPHLIQHTYFPTHHPHFRHTFPTYFPNHFIPFLPRPPGNSNILSTNEEEVLSHPFPFFFYLLIPTTFCCTHSPILRRKCSSIFIPLMVNCLMKSYAFSSFAFSVRFSAFNS